MYAFNPAYYHIAPHAHSQASKRSIDSVDAEIEALTANPMCEPTYERCVGPDIVMMRQGSRTDASSSFDFGSDFLDLESNSVFHGKPYVLSREEIMLLSRPLRVARPRPYRPMPSNAIGLTLNIEGSYSISEDGSSSVSSFSTLPSSVSSPDMASFKRQTNRKVPGADLLMLEKKLTFRSGLNPMSSLDFNSGHFRG